MPGIEFKLKSSGQFIAIFGLVLVLSVIILLFVSMSFWIKLAGLIGIVCYSIHLFREYILLNSDTAIRRLISHEDGWLLQTKQALLKAELCGESTITNFVSVLRFRIQHTKHCKTSIIFRDSVATGFYRRLVKEVNR